MLQLKEHLNESLIPISESKKEKNIILQKYNEDRSMVSVASCYNWLDELGWQKMSKSEYAEEIYNINDDIEPKFGEEEYGDVMVAMQKLGKVQAYEYLKSIDKYDEIEDYI